MLRRTPPSFPLFTLQTLPSHPFAVISELIHLFVFLASGFTKLASRTQIHKETEQRQLTISSDREPFMLLFLKMSVVFARSFMSEECLK